MTLILDLPPELEARLRTVARQKGTDPAECARQLLAEHLPAQAAAVEDPTVTLLRQWREQDATDDPAELQRAEAELQELQASLNASRAAAGARLLFP
jgi:hypothetical protein